MNKFQRLLCFFFGHNLTIISSYDNGRSIFTYLECSRCNYYKHSQYDK